MMDKTNFGILEKICGMTKIGRYVIVAPEEFFGSDGEDAAEALKKALSELSDEDFIDVKYSGEDMFCVAPLKPLPPPPAENTAPVKKFRLKSLINFRTPFFGGMLGGLLGGFLGGLIITLVFAVIYAR